MATIGSIMIGMSAKTEQLQKDLKKGSALVTAFASKVATVGVSAAAQLTKFVTGGVAAAAGGLGAFAVSAGRAIDETGDMADRLGTTTENLMALRYAAKLTGSDTEALDGALSKMNVNLGKAATEGGPTADALSKIGLDARALAQQDPTQAFIAITAGLEKIPNTAERASTAMAIFGKGGIGVLSSIGAGASELTRLSDELKKVGGISESTRQQIGAGFDAFDRMGTIVTAVGAKLAGEFAPYVVAAGEKLAQFASQGIDAGSIVSTGAKFIIDSIIVAADVVNGLGLAFLYVQKSATAALAFVVNGLAKLGQALDYVLKATTGLSTGIGELLTNIGSDLSKLAEEQNAAFTKASAQETYGAKVKKTFDAIKTEAALAKSSIDNMTKGVGAVTPQVDKVADANKKVFEAMKADAKRFTEEAMTPLEKFQAEQQKLTSLLQAGLIDQTTVDRITADAQKSLQGPGQDKPKRAAALDLGSKEARSAMLDFKAGRANEEPAKKTATNTAKTVTLQTDANFLLGQIVSALKPQVQSVVDAVF